MSALHSLSLDATTLSRGYREGRFTPSDVIEEVYRRIAAGGDHHVWLHLAPREEALARAAAVSARPLGEQPLFGLPYGVKDNIDVAGWPTTAGCEALRYVPQRSAAVVERLDAAGAINLGKQNMDQFATGLVGVRTVTPPARNAVDAALVPGGSSSGSAVAVAAGFTTFSIGSDTGGSGRVPAAFNNIVGLKPTPGLVSTRGFLYCNRTFDVPPVFALTVRDAQAVFDVIAGHDPEDAGSVQRPAGEHRWGHHSPPGLFRFALPRPDQLDFFGDDTMRRRFDAVTDLLHGLGGTPVTVDLDPFLEAGRLVFDSPLVAERWLTYGSTLEQHPEAVHPAVAQAIGNATRYTASDTFQALYRLQELQAITHRVLAGVDALVLPTVGTLLKVAEVEADPALNTRMGRYTYFANPLRLPALSVPAGFRVDGRPFGLSLIGPPFTDARLGALAHALQVRIGGRLGATATSFEEIPA